MGMMDRLKAFVGMPTQQARFIGTPPAAPGRHTIRALDGNCLLLDR